MSKPKVIAIVGPTASGKSALGTYLAQRLGGEIVSADSRQVYKGMGIISRAEPGHLVDILSPKRAFSADDYIKRARKCFDVMIHQNKIPVVVGGAGFYIDPLLRGQSLPPVPPNAALRKTLSKKTPERLFALLKKLDPASAKRVDPRNLVRVVRAIEIARALGRVPPRTSAPTYQTLWLGVNPPARKHAAAIWRGVAERLKSGMVAEAKHLRKALPRARYQALGFEFAALANYLDKKISKKELIDTLVRGEQKYAKRQIRWFKRHKDIHWIKNETEALKLAKKFLKSQAGPLRLERRTPLLERGVLPLKL